MADSTSLDYLGRESPLSLNEKPALPVGGTPLGIGSPGTPTASGGGSLPSAGGTAPQSVPGVAATAPTGGAAIPGALTDSPSASPDFSGGAGIMDKILAGGGPIADAIKKAMMGLQAEGVTDASSLDPRNFSLSGDEGGGLTLDAQNFSFDLGGLDGIMPELLRLQGAFDEGGAVLDPAAFNFSDPGGAAALDGGDFTLGADLDLGGVDGGAGFSIPYGGLLTGIASLIPAFLQGGSANQIGGSAVKALLGVASGLGANAAQTTGTFPMAAWNLPQIANSLAELFDPGPDNPNSTAFKRRTVRNADAASLDSEIMAPLMGARSPEELMSALKSSVGGSTVGDALAKMLEFQLGGGWFTDTAHDVLPNVEMRPTYDWLKSQGFGSSEPTRGDVGGVGEIAIGRQDQYDGILRALTSAITGKAPSEIQSTTARNRFQSVYDPNLPNGGDQATPGGYRPETPAEMLARLGLGGNLKDFPTSIPDYSLGQHIETVGNMRQFSQQNPQTWEQLFPNVMDPDPTALNWVQQGGFQRKMDPLTGQWVDGDFAYGGGNYANEQLAGGG